MACGRQNHLVKDRLTVDAVTVAAVLRQTVLGAGGFRQDRGFRHGGAGSGHKHRLRPGAVVQIVADGHGDAALTTDDRSQRLSVKIEGIGSLVFPEICPDAQDPLHGIFHIAQQGQGGLAAVQVQLQIAAGFDGL